MPRKQTVTGRCFKAASSYTLLAIMLLCVSPAEASQNKSTIVFKGALGGGGGLKIGPEQKLMLEASNKFVQMDYKGAEAAYTKVLEINSRNVSAYVQRGLIRREMQDYNGMRSDARTALSLLNSDLQQGRRDANLYYERSLAYRLLRQFNAAEQDLRMAMRLNPNANWENDFKAIALERKMAQ